MPLDQFLDPDCHCYLPRAFPGPEHTYGIAPEEIVRLKEQLRDRQRA